MNKSQTGVALLKELILVLFTQLFLEWLPSETAGQYC